MERYPDSHREFGYQREPFQNPFTGFTSFNHFRNSRLYSDVVVKPGNRLLETENLECYPVPKYVLENGREEGFYPDASVAYIRFLWREFEPEHGKYNYGFIDKIIEKARQNSQSIILRMMPHSTRAEDDVPEWLKSLIPCPDRPSGARVKDSPTDPMFIELYTEAVRRFAERFDREPLLFCVDICLPGAWGEGYKLEQYSDSEIEKLISAFTESFSHTILIGQIARPDMIRKHSGRAAIGWRADGFGDPFHVKELYPPLVEQLKDIWKAAPVSVESYWWLGEWRRQGWKIDELADISLDWHISFVNAKSLPIPLEWKSNIDRWTDRMGYHFRIDKFYYPGTASPGDILQFGIDITNTGVAPLYKEVPFLIRLRPFAECSEDAMIVSNCGEINPCKWFPGNNSDMGLIRLPDNVPPGEYFIDFSVTDGQNNIMFCTDAERYGFWYNLAKITIM